MTLIKQSELKLMISQWNWNIASSSRNTTVSDRNYFTKSINRGQSVFPGTRVVPLVASLIPHPMPHPLSKCCKQTCVYAHDGSSPAEVRNNTCTTLSFVKGRLGVPGRHTFTRFTPPFRKTGHT